MQSPFHHSGLKIEIGFRIFVATLSPYLELKFGLLS